MGPSYFTVFIAFLLLLWLSFERSATIRRIIMKKKKRRRIRMNELISGFVCKDCIVYISASSGTSINGVITSLNENWITVKTAGGEEVINLDYVIRVKEHPVGKNGKKKKIVF